MAFRILLIIAVLSSQLLAGLHEDIDALFPAAQATHKAVKIDGKWEEPSTWSPPEVPTDGARVLLPCNTVTKLHGSTANLQWIRDEGVLTVCDHCDTQLNVHTLYIPMHGKFVWGMPDMPIKANAVIEIVPGSACGLAGDYLPGDWMKDTLGILCFGEFMVHGSEKTAWLEIEAVAEKGATSIVPRDLSHQWVPGDLLMIAGTDSIDGPFGEDRYKDKYQTEFRKLTAVDGRTLHLDAGLKYRHFPWQAGLKYHVADLSRNVVIRSRDSSVIDHRGHMMFMSPMNDIRYARVEGMGRTDKSQSVTDPRKDAKGVLVPGSDVNPRRHYADHNHRTGPMNAPSIRRWVVYDGKGGGWGAVNHASHCQWDNCIGFDFFGAAFVTEEGQERGHMRRCLAALNRGRGDTVSSTDEDHVLALDGKPNGDFGSDGSGFWLQGPLVEVSYCVSFDNSGRGFALFNRPLNGYPIYGAGNPMPPHLRYEISHARSVLPLIDQYVPLLDAAGYANAPSSTVPQQVFARNTAYGTKIGVQGWSGPTHNDSSRLIWPLASRGSITDLTLWGRGGRLHLEYMRQVNVSGLRIYGDRGFRRSGTYLSNSAEAVLLRSPEVTIRNWSIKGVPNRFTIDGANDPGGISGKNIVIEGATVNKDGSVVSK